LCSQEELKCLQKQEEMQELLDKKADISDKLSLKEQLLLKS